MSTDNKPMKRFIVPNLRRVRDMEKLKINSAMKNY